ncbi:MAG: dephospho-CoA kinase [Thermoanaerobaculia bacterium]|nr:dephospho-CoA kinase [Thermoanaerobaculia bacterium]
MATFRLGLTGGLASGKSTVARRLAELGATVVDADRLVAELYAPGGKGAQAVAELFGPDFLTASGAVDKPRLAARIFDDSAARTRLEAAIHPLVRQRFEETAVAASGIAVLEATLLIEAGYKPGFDLVVTVEAPEAVRLARAITRGLPEAEAKARLAAQGDGTRRREGADRVIWNEGGREELERQVAELWEEIAP